MSYAATAPFKSGPRMSRGLFIRVLVEAGSPWADRAGEIHDLIVAGGHDPAVWLAICAREHRYGTNRDSVLWRNDTRSWTNARTVRDPSITGWRIITDPVRKSQYVQYADVLDSIKDGMYRVTDPTYRYVQEGRTTIGQVLGIWTEDPGPYTGFVINLINSWDGELGHFGGDTALAPWAPAASTHFTAGRSVDWPDLLIFHHTDGYDSFDWLRWSSPTRVSATYLMARNGTPRAQLVRHRDTPHTTAVMNPRSISFEWERKWGDPAQLAIPDSTYENLGQWAAEVCRIERRRGNPHFQGLPGAWQFRDHNDFYDTVCPGNLDVRRIYEIAYRALSTPVIVIPLPESPADDRILVDGNPKGPYGYRLGFKGHVLRLGAAASPANPEMGALAIFGWPEEDEWQGANGHSYQRTQRYILEWQPGVDSPWDITGTLRGEDLPERKDAA